MKMFSMKYFNNKNIPSASYSYINTLHPKLRLQKRLNNQILSRKEQTPKSDNQVSWSPKDKEENEGEIGRLKSKHLRVGMPHQSPHITWTLIGKSKTYSLADKNISHHIDVTDDLAKIDQHMA